MVESTPETKPNLTPMQLLSSPSNYTPEEEEDANEIFKKQHMTARAFSRDLQKAMMQNKEGYLEKRENKIFGDAWEERFVELENQELSYYKENEEGERIRMGILDFDIYQVTIEVDGKEPGFNLRIRNSDHEFSFRAPSEMIKDGEKRQYLQDWIDEISIHLQESEGTLKKLAGPEMDIKFWHSDQMTVESFMNKADTFDLLLCQCNTK
jgi:hypothetical protein